MCKTGQIPSGFIWSHLEYKILINYSIINEWNFSNATSALRDPLYHIEDWAKVMEATSPDVTQNGIIFNGNFMVR